MYNYTQKARLVCISCVLLLSFVLLIFRLFFIQVFRYPYFSKLADGQHLIKTKLEPVRGTIYDRNLSPLAVSLKMSSVYADPREIKDKNHTAAYLARVLNKDQETILKQINRDKPFVWLDRKISNVRAQQVLSMKLSGIGTLRESKRIYPAGNLASHVLGLVGMDNEGLEGIELRYDDYLKGSPGWRFSARDAKRREVVSLRHDEVLPVDGYDLILTIDEVIQHIAERELEEAWRKSNAISASIIVMDPRSGEILAMANRPGFDPNNFGSSEPHLRRNRAITDTFEPGSTFKLVTASAALEKGVVNPGYRIFCENGAYPVAGRVLHDHKPHGWLTFREVVEESSNIGMVKVGGLVGKGTLYHYVRAFGFGSLTGVDMPGETKGILHPLNLWSKTTMTSIPMGHELSVTAIQMAQSAAVIANGGVLVKPHIAKELRDGNGKAVKTWAKEPLRRIISEAASRQLTAILTGVVENGTGRMAKVTGYRAAGKTGTAQKLEPDGTYSHNKFIASFIGFAPAENPVICIAIVIDEPRPVYYGGVVAAPVFANVAGAVLKLLKVQPTAPSGPLRLVQSEVVLD